MIRFTVSLAVLALAVGLPACAANPSLEGARVAESIAPGMEKLWQEGRKDEAEGLKKLAKADADIASDRARILEGERLIAEGTAGVDAQKAAYKSFSLRVGAATGAKEAKVESQSLAAIVKAWADSEDTLRKGTKTVKDARKDFSKAEKAKRKAEEKIAEGRADMLRASITMPELQQAPEAVDSLTDVQELLPEE